MSVELFSNLSEKVRPDHRDGIALDISFMYQLLPKSMTIIYIYRFNLSAINSFVFN